MAFMQKLRDSIFIFIVFYLGLAFLPSNLLLDLEPEAFTTLQPVLEGALARNEKLESTERIYENKLINPECIDAWEGVLYTGLEDGRIVRLKDGKVETVVRIGGINCDKKPHGCGRPNGLRFDKNGSLIVADPVRGVYRVDVSTGDITYLFSITEPVDGKLAKGPNHPHFSQSGEVYFSDVSTKRDMSTNYYEFVEVAPNGRVLRYDPQTKKTSTVVDKLYFPNGVQLSPKEDFLVIAQSAKYNLLKYNLKGPRKGVLEVFVDNLPGIPDNIHTSPRGTFWIGLAGVRLPEKRSVFETLGPYPTIRKVIGRLVFLTSASLEWLAKHVPLPFLHTLLDQFQSFKMDLFLGPHYGFVIEVDTNGKILRSLQSPSGHIHHISHAFEHEGFLYMGTPFHPVIGKVALNN